MKDKIISTGAFLRNQLILFVISLIVAIGCYFIPHRIPEIIEADISISKSYVAPLNISWIITYVIACIVCIILVTILFVPRQDYIKVLIRETIICLRSYCNVIIVALLMTRAVSLPRPCFFSMCVYDPLSQNDHRYGISGRVGDLAKCTAPIDTVKQSIESFPSIPAVIYFTTLSLTILYSYIIMFKSNRINKKLSSLLFYIEFTVLSLFSLLMASVDIRSNYNYVSDMIVSLLLSLFITIWTNNSIQDTYFYSIKYNTYYSSLNADIEPDYDLIESDDCIKKYFFQRLISKQTSTSNVFFCICLNKQF